MEPSDLRRYHEGARTFRAVDGAADGADDGADDGAASRPAGRGGDPAAALVPDALGYLRGRWRLERRLADHVAGGTGTFTGMAQFAPLGEAELAYHEQGELLFGRHRGPASRRLVYRGRPDGTADVCFADGREFYRLDPRSGRWRGEHQCGADHYAVAGHVLGRQSFREHWRARGPDTDYEIITTLIRA